MLRRLRNSTAGLPDVGVLTVVPLGAGMLTRVLGGADGGSREDKLKVECLNWCKALEHKILEERDTSSCEGD